MSKFGGIQLQKGLTIWGSLPSVDVRFKDTNDISACMHSLNLQPLSALLVVMKFNYQYDIQENVRDNDILLLRILNSIVKGYAGVVSYGSKHFQNIGFVFNYKLNGGSFYFIEDDLTLKVKSSILQITNAMQKYIAKVNLVGDSFTCIIRKNRLKVCKVSKLVISGKEGFNIMLDDYCIIDSLIVRSGDKNILCSPKEKFITSLSWGSSYGFHKCFRYCFRLTNLAITTKVADEFLEIMSLLKHDIKSFRFLDLDETFDIMSFRGKVEGIVNRGRFRDATYTKRFSFLGVMNMYFNSIAIPEIDISLPSLVKLDVKDLFSYLGVDISSVSYDIISSLNSYIAKSVAYCGGYTSILTPLLVESDVYDFWVSANESYLRGLLKAIVFASDINAKSDVREVIICFGDSDVQFYIMRTSKNFDFISRNIIALGNATRVLSRGDMDILSVRLVKGANGNVFNRGEKC